VDAAREAAPPFWLKEKKGEEAEIGKATAGSQLVAAGGGHLTLKKGGEKEIGPSQDRRRQNSTVEVGYERREKRRGRKGNPANLTGEEVRKTVTRRLLTKILVKSERVGPNQRSKKKGKGWRAEVSNQVGEAESAKKSQTFSVTPQKI